ncbi:MAG: AAA family ATPase [Verrucomicrobiae bacterium]|nr:AAA family ATPase [Verrucomicrobiae bacterium]
MATIVPSRLPAKCTEGEARLHALLARLPEDCVVYYEPNLNGRHPDFVILSPQLGILVIEDKNWRPGTIVRGNLKSVTIRVNDQEKSVTHPIEQARAYREELQRAAERCRFGRHFLHLDGPHQGRLKFPVGQVVTLSNITSRQLDDPNRPLRDIFPAGQVVTRDQLEEWMDLSPQELLETLRNCFSIHWSFNPLTETEIRALRALVHPEIDFDQRFSIESLDHTPRPIHDRQDVLKVLDLRQEECAASIGEGHRILYGVAGSGKTIILVTRARLLATINPKANILLVCYNRRLSHWLKRQLADLPRVTVSTFHQLAKRNGAIFEITASAETVGKQLLDRLRLGTRDSGAYDAILVDEAQDFEPVWFTCLLAAMKDPDDGDLLIVADGAQGIYKRSKVSWSKLGIKARGRTSSVRFDLDQNYRNSTEILTLAETFATRTESFDAPDDSIASLRVDPGRCVRSTGAAPLLFHEANRDSEEDRIIDIVGDLLKGLWNGGASAPLSPNEIGILYPSASPREKKTLALLPGKLAAAYQIESEWLGASASEVASLSTLKIQTIHSSKGLQYRAVILMWADKLPDKRATWEQEGRDRRLLYVAMTRAESFLAITCSGSSEFLDDIANSPAAVSIDRRARPTKEALQRSIA